MGEPARAFVEGASRLPIMPPIASEVLRHAEGPDVDVAAIARLISRDAGLAIRVLRIANSSCYAGTRRIETLQQAILLLGCQTLRSVVTAAAMKDAVASFGLAEHLFWEHSVGAAIAATTVARHVGECSRDEAFLGGLIHDVGKLVMHSRAEDEYQKVLTAVYAHGREPVDAEREVFGFDHARVGGLAVSHWRLSPRLVAAIEHHHDPDAARKDREGRKLSALVQVADRMCVREGLGRRVPVPELDPTDCPGGRILGLASAEGEELQEMFRAAHDADREVFG